MPYYKWIGINLEGVLKKGTLFARSQQALATVLLEPDVGIIKTKMCLLQKRLNKDAIISLIQHIATLLEGGIRLNHALEIVKDTTCNMYLKDIVSDIKLHVEEGESFSYTLSFYPEIFNAFLVSLIEVGQATGTLSQSLRHYIAHSYYIKEINQSLKSTLINPFITFIFFIFTSIALLLFIVPQFESIFTTFNEPLPQSTLLILSLSQYISSFLQYSNLLIILVVNFLGLMLFKNIKKNYIRHFFLLNMPYVRKISILIYRAQVLYMLAILLEKGIRIVEALKIMRKVLNNKYIIEDLASIQWVLEQGVSFSSAFDQSTYFNCRELNVVIRVGESSGSIIEVIKYSAFLYQQDAYKKLKSITILVQPLLLLLLGCLIAGLIFALYIPLFTLTAIVN